MIEYNIDKIERKWQKKWNDKSFMKKGLSSNREKYYSLTMFSYPSGSNLHIGHWYNYGPADTYSRYKRMKGYDVFQPQGFDAFGLPAENFAIKHDVHPAKSTQKNINTMRRQLDRIGALYDWENIVVTCQKDYYKWTQWLFLELYKNNLAYRKKATVNWDPVDQTVLANEQVLANGTSERSGALVEQRPLEQWFFKITNYAEELLSFKDIDWPNKTVNMQKHWIGKSVGASLKFKLEKFNDEIEVFTTRPDTLFGATYMVVAPEHYLVNKITIEKNKNDVKDYIAEISKKNEMQRTDLNKDKSGVFTGSYAINPVNNKKIPIWIGDYVLVTYGSGAIMAVPGHDERDYEFAKKYDLHIAQVVDGKGADISKQAYCEDGRVINSGFLNGLNTKTAKQKMIDYLDENNIGKSKVQYKLKDWLISRQRYWGTPIPIVYDPNGSPHPIPVKHLPWELPDDVEYKPKGTSPLGTSQELLDRTEKIFGEGWRPEIDTMDTFVCSSWYYLRYPDNKNTKKPFDSNLINKMLPVDIYIGGSEHATMHLLYARFINKALRDLGYLDFNEPFKKLYHQGTITKDGSKMSKSKGNTVSPDDFIEEYGSDTFRCYLMFMGPFDEGGDWNDKGIKGIYRFLNKIITICNRPDTDETELDYQKIIHKTIKGVGEDLERIKFNTAISKLMTCSNELNSAKSISINDKKVLIKLLAPFAPHLSEELWEDLGEEISIFNNDWPEYSKNLIIDDTMTIAIQVNGKLRGSIDVDKNIDKENILKLSKDNNNVQKFIKGKIIVKEIYVPNKLISLVVK